MRQTLCDTCGEDVDRVSPRHVCVELEGQVRPVDRPKYELCEPCWEHALSSARTRVRQHTEAVADLIAQRAQERRADHPRPEAAHVALGDTDLTCEQCDFVAKLRDVTLGAANRQQRTAGGTLVFDLRFPCGHRQERLSVLKNDDGYLTELWSDGVPPPPLSHLATMCWCLEVNCQAHPQPGDTAADEEAS